MSEATSMKLFRTKEEEDDAAEKVKLARYKVDMAVLKMDSMLTKVEATANKAKEELRGRSPA